MPGLAFGKSLFIWMGGGSRGATTQVCQTETGWGLGPLAAVPAPGHTSPPPQNTKKPSGPKNNHVHGQPGQILDNRIQKDQNPNATCEDLGAKAGYAPCTQNHHGVSRPSQPPLQSDPGHTPTLTPYKERVGKGTRHVFSLPPSATGASVKLSPTFPFWPGVNFY